MVVLEAPRTLVKNAEAQAQAIELRRMEEEEEKEAGKAPVYDQHPVKVTCPYCRGSVTTYIDYETTGLTYMAALVCVLTLNWASICVVPILWQVLKDVVHHCPRCLSVLGRRSRVGLPNWRQQVMQFRLGSCVVVLQRKWVLVLLVLVVLIFGIHWARDGSHHRGGLLGAIGPQGEVVRGPDSDATWQDFAEDCGVRSYLGNPIHVSVAFDKNYKNRTVHWNGQVHRHRDTWGFFLLFGTRGLMEVRMDPPQQRMKGNLPDLLLEYDSPKVREIVAEIPDGAWFDFEATMLEVGRRGAPHLAWLWSAKPAEKQRPPRKKKQAEKAQSSHSVGGPSGSGDAAAKAAASVVVDPPSLSPRSQAAATTEKFDHVASSAGDSSGAATPLPGSSAPAAEGSAARMVPPKAAAARAPTGDSGGGGSPAQ